MKIKTSELQGPALDWAVAACEGYAGIALQERTNTDWYSPSTNWAQGGPIIEREKIRLDTTWNCEDGYWSARMDTVGGWWLGDTPLIAAMRCYVASKLGDNIDIPEELK
jgi:hypothetical protein